MPRRSDHTLPAPLSRVAAYVDTRAPRGAGHNGGRPRKATVEEEAPAEKRKRGQHTPEGLERIRQAATARWAAKKGIGNLGKSSAAPATEPAPASPPTPPPPADATAEDLEAYADKLLQAESAAAPAPATEPLELEAYAEPDGEEAPDLFAFEAEEEAPASAKTADERGYCDPYAACDVAVEMLAKRAKDTQEAAVLLITTLTVYANREDVQDRWSRRDHPEALADLHRLRRRLADHHRAMRETVEALGGLIRDGEKVLAGVEQSHELEGAAHGDPQ